MEKVTELIVEQKHFLVDMAREIWADAVDSVKHNLWQLIMQILGTISSVFLFLQEKIKYQEILQYDEGFLKYIVPTMIGSATYAFLNHKKEAVHQNRVIIFIVSIAFSAYAVEGILGLFHVIPDKLWYIFGGFLMYPFLELLAYSTQKLKKEVPRIIVVFLNNRLGNNNKDDEEGKKDETI